LRAQQGKSSLGPASFTTAVCQSDDRHAVTPGATVGVLRVI
jgi:hypothetical protein